MGERKRVGNGREDVGDLLVGEGSALDALQQLGDREAVDVLHHEVGEAVVDLEVEDGHDVGVREQARRARLRQDLLCRRGVGVVCCVGADDGDALDGHTALQARVPAGADRAEAAASGAAEHAVSAEQHLFEGFLPRRRCAKARLFELLRGHGLSCDSAACVRFL